MLIRTLDPITDRAAVQSLYQSAADYWALDRLTPDPETQSAEFFTDAPPNCDPKQSQRLGLFLENRLAGIAELSFGFPAPQDAYLGLMIFAPWARGQGLGQALLREVETRARAKPCTEIFLGVLDANPKGRAFWLREGFRDTGLSRVDTDNGVSNTIRRLHKPL
jgi:ribosomal protein S18 acetylase RimI-like enzyme